MQLSEAYHHINNSERRKHVIEALSQPLTALHLARKTGLSFDSCRDVVCELAGVGLLRCLNPEATRSRLYWLTPLGVACQRRILSTSGLCPRRHGFPRVDWSLYGWVCFSHRAAIIKTLTRPLQPSEIKRKARSHDPGLRMSANNVRDVIRLFVARGIVVPVPVPRKAHVCYRLTDTGEQLRILLLSAEPFGRHGGGAA